MAAKTTNPTTKLLMLVGLLVAGCGPEQDPASFIERTRVLGAQVEVDGAPGRATPKPGESAQVTWLVTAPGDVPPLGWAFAVCPSDGRSLDCTTEPLALVQGHGEPRLTMTVPAAADLGGASMLVVTGRVCDGSEPIIDERSGRPGCTDGGDGTTASVAVPLDLEVAGSGPNQNPSLTDAPSWFDGAAWAGPAPAPAPASGSASCDGLPSVAAGTKEHVIRLETRGADREDYTAMLGDPPAPTARREPMQVSQFTTAGELARSFSFVEAADPSDAPVVEVKWDAPEASAVPAEGRLVRFTFVARDLRGGIGWTTRAACVTP